MMIREKVGKLYRLRREPAAEPKPQTAPPSSASVVIGILGLALTLSSLLLHRVWAVEDRAVGELAKRLDRIEATQLLILQRLPPVSR